MNSILEKSQQCQRCGRCCRGTEVRVLPSDQIPADMVNKGAGCYGDDIMKTREGLYCIAYDVKGNGCSIYGRHPLVCKEFIPGGSLCEICRKVG